MSERDERVSALVEWLNEQGAAAGSSIHGWRCEYPDRYGECDCVAEMARDLLDSPAMRDLLAEERRATAERIARAIEAGVLPWHPNEGYKDGFRHAAQIARETA